MTKPGHLGYHLNNQTQQSLRKAGPFPVTKRIGDLSDELRLPSHLGWNKKISAEHLEPVAGDSWSRQQTAQGRVDQVEGEDRYILDEITRYAVVKTPASKGKRLQYKSKWMGYGDDSYT